MSGPILRLSSRVAALVLPCIVFATSVEGQVTVVPTFPVGPSQLGGRALNTEVAVGTDGSLLFAWTNTFGAGPLVAVRSHVRRRIAARPAADAARTIALRARHRGRSGRRVHARQRRPRYRDRRRLSVGGSTRSAKRWVDRSW